MRFINIIMVFGIMTTRDFKLDLVVCLHKEIIVPNDFSSMLYIVYANGYVFQTYYFIFYECNILIKVIETRFSEWS